MVEGKTERQGEREGERETELDREDKGREAARGKEGVLVRDGERARSRAARPWREREREINS